MYLKLNNTIEAQGGFQVQDAVLVLQAFTATNIIVEEEEKINLYIGCKLFKSLADYENGASELTNTNQNSTFNYVLDFDVTKCFSFECVYELLAENESNLILMN